MNKVCLSFTLCLLLATCTAQPYWSQPSNLEQYSVTPDLSPTAEYPWAFEWKSYTVIGNVNIHAKPFIDSPVVGVLYAGALIPANCNRSDGFCDVIGGYVIEACLGIGEGVCR